MPLTPKQSNKIKTKLCVYFLFTYIAEAHNLFVATIIATIRELSRIKYFLQTRVI